MNYIREIHGLLSEVLNDFASAQGIEVKWEGMPDAPPASDALYLREWLLPGQFTCNSLGISALNTGPIIYQVDVIAKLQGWGRAYEIANLFFSDPYFKRGQTLSSVGNTARVVIRAGQVGPATREGTKYILPMSVYCTAYTII